MIVFIVLVGLLIGSFLNVCIYRIPREESIAYPSSHCTTCNTYLKPLDLVPVLSYIVYGGKCKYCKDNISIRYPFIELFNCFVFVLLYLRFGLSIKFIAYAILSSTLLAMSVIDFDYQIIPDGIVVFILLLGLAYKLASMVLYRVPYPLIDSIVGFLIGGGFFLLIAILSNGGMGGGDIKLMGALGFWLGWKLTLLMMLLSFLIGGVLSILLITFKKKGRKEAIPFGPFIAIATFITICWHQEILVWYVGMFFNNY
ncbi:prepilin peptidase [Serpentinicella alkaliphila]|uniref:Prepilin leader peptidase/N-methyltransferase n=1 Tax=Serpentinicella alkaliphila TaxID=1734049 RepID=A0A4V2T389_9FIRM|nr:A24 family peptidase [Serpentinicella alkaliphila]QUH26668.1 prepilin peptidase [Serpentinicella alkaliphila]TCQ00534.1 leader peptidase (prepilin peptidase)/N-methyltransferase [Serpentinicella alkaliphila]